MINKLRSLASGVMAPEHRPALGAMFGAGISAGPAIALAPETAGLSLLLPTVMAGLGGAAGSASADLGTTGKVNPSRMIDQGLDQSKQQLMFGDLPGGALRELMPPAMRSLAIAGNRNALRPNVPDKVLTSMENPATGMKFDSRGDALDQLAHDELVAGHGEVGSREAASSAADSVRSSTQQANDLMSRAPKHPSTGQPQIGMMKGADISTLQDLGKDQDNARRMQEALSKATRQDHFADSLPRGWSMHSLARSIEPGATAAQAAWSLAKQPMGSVMSGVPNLMRLVALLQGGGQ